jgi:hypothetical protein
MSSLLATSVKQLWDFSEQVNSSQPYYRNLIANIQMCLHWTKARLAFMLSFVGADRLVEVHQKN